MRLTVLFVLHGDGKHDAWEARTVADEYTMAVNPDYMQGRHEDARALFKEARLVEIEVDDEALRKALDTPRIEGTVVEPE